MQSWILIALLSVSAGPTTSPTTKPLNAVVLQQSIEDARAAIVKAKDAALSRCRETPEYQAAAADREAKQHLLEDARRDGSPENRLAASSVFVKADLVVKKMEAEAISEDDAVKTSSAELTIAEASLRGVREEQKQQQEIAAASAKMAKENNPIAVAIRQHRIVKGMTVSQAHEAFEGSIAISYYGHFGPRNVTDNSDLEDGTQVVRWRSLVPSDGGPFVARSVTIKVRDGKVISVEDVDNNP